MAVTVKNYLKNQILNALSHFKGASSGLAPLDSNAKLPQANLTTGVTVNQLITTACDFGDLLLEGNYIITTSSVASAMTNSPETFTCPISCNVIRIGGTEDLDEEGEDLEQIITLDLPDTNYYYRRIMSEGVWQDWSKIYYSTLDENSVVTVETATEAIDCDTALPSTNKMHYFVVIPTTTLAQECDNLPVISAGQLEIIGTWNQGTGCQQVYRPNGSTTYYTRYYASSVWSSWVSLSFETSQYITSPVGVTKIYKINSSANYGISCNWSCGYNNGIINTTSQDCVTSLETVYGIISYYKDDVYNLYIKISGYRTIYLYNRGKVDYTITDVTDDETAQGYTYTSTAKLITDNALGRYNLLGSLTANSSDLSDASKLLQQQATPTTTNGTVLTVTALKIWNYIKSKIQSVYLDSIPTSGSANLITSSGVYDNTEKVIGKTSIKCVTNLGLTLASTYTLLDFFSALYDYIGTINHSDKILLNNSASEYINLSIADYYTGDTRTIKVQGGTIELLGGSDSLSYNLSDDTSSTSKYFKFKYIPHLISGSGIEYIFYISIGTTSVASGGSYTQTVACNGESLTIAQGGTGATTALEAQHNLLNNMNTASTSMSDSTLLTGAYISSSSSTGSIYKRTALTVAQYILGKLDSYFIHSHRIGFYGCSSITSSYVYNEPLVYLNIASTSNRHCKWSGRIIISNRGSNLSSDLWWDVTVIFSTTSSTINTPTIYIDNCNTSQANLFNYCKFILAIKSTSNAKFGIYCSPSSTNYTTVICKPYNTSTSDVGTGDYDSNYTTAKDGNYIYKDSWQYNNAVKIASSNENIVSVDDLIETLEETYTSSVTQLTAYTSNTNYQNANTATTATTANGLKTYVKLLRNNTTSGTQTDYYYLLGSGSISNGSVALLNGKIDFTGSSTYIKGNLDFNLSLIKNGTSGFKTNLVHSLTQEHYSDTYANYLKDVKIILDITNSTSTSSSDVNVYLYFSSNQSYITARALYLQNTGFTMTSSDISASTSITASGTLFESIDPNALDEIDFTDIVTDINS